jgi:8-oxo-dGTP diphosphatase
MSGSDSPVVGVGVVLIQDNQILLIKRARDPERGKWAVPGGKVRKGESMRDAARREVAEETGLHVEVGDLAWMGEVINDQVHLVIVDYFGSVVGGDLQAGDDAEDARWVPLDEASDYPLTMTMYDLVDTLRS